MKMALCQHPFLDSRGSLFSALLDRGDGTTNIHGLLTVKPASLERTGQLKKDRKARCNESPHVRTSLKFDILYG